MIFCLSSLLFLLIATPFATADPDHDRPCAPSEITISNPGFTCLESSCNLLFYLKRQPPLSTWQNCPSALDDTVKCTGLINGESWRRVQSTYWNPSSVFLNLPPSSRVTDVTCINSSPSGLRANWFRYPDSLPSTPSVTLGPLPSPLPPPTNLKLRIIQPNVQNSRCDERVSRIPFEGWISPDPSFILSFQVPTTNMQTLTFMSPDRYFVYDQNHPWSYDTGTRTRTATNQRFRNKFGEIAADVFFHTLKSPEEDCTGWIHNPETNITTINIRLSVTVNPPPEYGPFLFYVQVTARSGLLSMPSETVSSSDASISPLPTPPIIVPSSLFSSSAPPLPSSSPLMTETAAAVISSTTGINSNKNTDKSHDTISSKTKRITVSSSTAIGYIFSDIINDTVLTDASVKVVPSDKLTDSSSSEFSILLVCIIAVVLGLVFLWVLYYWFCQFNSRLYKKLGIGKSDSAEMKDEAETHEREQREAAKKYSIMPTEQGY